MHLSSKVAPAIIAQRAHFIRYHRCTTISTIIVTHKVVVVRITHFGCGQLWLDLVIINLISYSLLEKSDYWWNTVVLGRMYRSILSSCWGIEAQYWLTSGAKRRRRPVLPLNSEAWWQYWPIHPTQNYCILIVSISTFVPNIGFFHFSTCPHKAYWDFSVLVHVLIRRIEIFQF